MNESVGIVLLHVPQCRVLCSERSTGGVKCSLNGSGQLADNVIRRPPLASRLRCVLLLSSRQLLCGYCKPC